MVKVIQILFVWLFKICLGLSVVFSFKSSLAGTLTGTVDVFLTLNSWCKTDPENSLKLGSITFPTSDTDFPSKLQASVAGNVKLKCSKGASMKIKVDMGGNLQSGGGRAMKSAAGNLVPYRLYADQALVKEFTSASTEIPVAFDSSSATGMYLPIVGTVDPAPANAPYLSGAYTDTVGVTVNF